MGCCKSKVSFDPQEYRIRHVSIKIVKQVSVVENSTLSKYQSTRSIEYRTQLANLQDTYMKPLAARKVSRWNVNTTRHRRGSFVPKEDDDTPSRPLKSVIFNQLLSSNESKDT